MFRDKNIIRLILLFSVISLTNSCSKGCLLEYDYFLILNIRNTAGADKLEGIPYDSEPIGYIVTDDPNGWNAKLIPNSYKWSINGYLSDEKMPLLATKVDNNCYLSLRTADFNLMDIITHKITCPDIFGDDMEHTIVSYWRRSNKFTNRQLECYLILFDGKEFSVALKKFTQYYSEEDRDRLDLGDKEFFKTISTGWLVLDN